MAYFKSKPNSFIKAFIASDAMLYSALNLVNILFAVFVTTEVSGGTIQAATAALTAGVVTRVLTELFAGKKISGLPEAAKLNIITTGMALISISYVGFGLAQSLYPIIVFWLINGVGWGLAQPTKLSLVSKYIKHDQSNQEWGLTDAINMSLVAAAMVAGGFIVANYDFELLFLLAACLNTLGIAPYILYGQLVKQPKLKSSSSGLVLEPVKQTSANHRKFQDH